MQSNDLQSAGKLKRYRVTVVDPPPGAKHGFVTWAQNPTEARQAIAEHGFVIRSVKEEPP